MKYFKAEIYMTTELYVDNDINKGIDPEHCYDSGLVQTITKPTLLELRDFISQDYDYIEHFEENRYETGFETRQRDGTHESVMVSIYITEVIEIEIDCEDLFNKEVA